MTIGMIPPDLSTHEKAILSWVRELRKNNQNKRYIILKKPLPDVIEIDLEIGKITVLEYENSHTTIQKEIFYQKTLSDFDEVYIKCRRSETRFPLEKRHNDDQCKHCSL